MNCDEDSMELFSERNFDEQDKVSGVNILEDTPKHGEIPKHVDDAIIVGELHSESTTVIEANKEREDEASILETSYYELRAKLEEAEMQHKIDQEEIYKLNRQIETQTAFGLNVGATMGHLVWRASHEPEVIESWVTKESSVNKVEEFVSIADRIIGTFFEMYQESLPPSTTDEFQFVMGLLGTLVNMSGIPEGRKFLIVNKDGKDLLRNFVTLLPRIPTNSGMSFKRALITILWNMSVNNTVLNYLFELKIGETIAHCIDESNPEKLRLLGFELLMSITYNLTDPKLLEDILEYVKIEAIRRIADTGQDKVSAVAQKFLKHVRSREGAELTLRDAK